MKSISTLVTEMIDEDLSIQDAMQRRYANITAISRLLKPRLEETLGKKVKIQAVITAAKRVKPRYAVNSEEILKVVSESLVTVRTDVAKLVVERTKRAVQMVARALAEYEEEFIHIAGGPTALTIILDRKVADEVRGLFRGDEIVDDRRNLAAITVQSPKEIVETPGCAITFYNQVSRRHINIEDTSSCHTDTIIVVGMDEAGRAFTALSDIISSTRRIRGKESIKKNG